MKRSHDQSLTPLEEAAAIISVRFYLRLFFYYFYQSQNEPSTPTIIRCIDAPIESHWLCFTAILKISLELCWIIFKLNSFLWDWNGVSHQRLQKREREFFFHETISIGEWNIHPFKFPPWNKGSRQGVPWSIIREVAEATRLLPLQLHDPLRKGKPRTTLKILERWKKLFVHHLL